MKVDTASAACSIDREAAFNATPDIGTGLVGFFILFVTFRSFTDSLHAPMINAVVNLLVILPSIFYVLTVRKIVLPVRGWFLSVSVFFLFFCLYSHLYAPYYNSYEILKVTFLVLFFFAGAVLPVSRSTWPIRSHIFLCMLIVGGGLLNLFLGNYIETEGMMRLDSFYAHPNPYGLHLMLIVSFFWVLRGGTNGVSKRCLEGGILICFYVYLNIANFGSLVYLSVFFILYYLKFEFNVRFIYVLALLIVVGVAGGGGIYLASDYMQARVDFLLASNILEMGDYPRNSFEWRLFNWQYYIENVKSFYLGNGIGASFDFYKEPHRESFSVAMPHNEFVRIYFEVGAVGLAFILALLWCNCVRLGRSSRAVAFAFIAASFFDNFFTSTALVMNVIITIKALGLLEPKYLKVVLLDERKKGWDF